MFGKGKEGMLKMALNMIGTDTINETLRSAVPSFVEYIKTQEEKIELQEGERQIVLTFFREETEIYAMVNAVDDSMNVVRKINAYSIKDFVAKFDIKQLFDKMDKK